MGFFDNDRYGYDGSYSSVNEAAGPLYNNRYSGISDMYEVACQLEIDGNDLIHEMEMNILMNEHNYFVEHGRAVQYSDGYGYLTEEGNSVWRFIQKAWETLMKYLDQCVSWVIDKCKEYMIYFKQLWAQKVSVRDGINGFTKSISEAAGKADWSKAATIKSSIISAINDCTVTSKDVKVWKAYPTLKGTKIISKTDIIGEVDTVIKGFSADDGKNDMRDAIREKLHLDEILGENKADSTDQLYLYTGQADGSKIVSDTDTEASKAMSDNAMTLNQATDIDNSKWKVIQGIGSTAYKLLQKEFSDSIKDVFEHIRDKKKDLRQERIDNRADDGENETFKKFKKQIKAYNITASLIMKSYSMKIKLCVTIVNRCVSCLNKIKTALTSNKKETPASKSFSYVSDRDSYNGGYQALF